MFMRLRHTIWKNIDPLHRPRRDLDHGPTSRFFYERFHPHTPFSVDIITEHSQRFHEQAKTEPTLHDTNSLCRSQNARDGTISDAGKAQPRPAQPTKAIVQQLNRDLVHHLWPPNVARILCRPTCLASLVRRRRHCQMFRLTNPFPFRCGANINFHGTQSGVGGAAGLIEGFWDDL